MQVNILKVITCKPSSVPGNGSDMIFIIELLQPIEYGFTAHDPGENDNNLTISGGGSLFSIDSDTGEISIIAPVDYEKGQGMISGDPNIYTLEVNASTPTSSNQASHLVYITVTNVVEPPSFDLNLDSKSTFAENEMWEREIIFLNEDTSVDRFLEISGGADTVLKGMLQPV